MKKKPKLLPRSQPKVAPKADPKRPAKAADEGIRGEVAEVFASGGLEAVVALFVDRLTALEASHEQLAEALRLAKLGRSRSGSERGPHGSPGASLQATLPLDDGQSDGEDDDDSGPDSADGEAQAAGPASGLKAAEIQRQAERARQIEDAIAARKKELRDLEKKKREEQEKANGKPKSGKQGDGGSDARNRVILDDPTIPSVQVPYVLEPHERTCTCGQLRKAIRFVKRSWLVWVPGHFEVHHCEAPVTVCSAACDEGGVTEPRSPALVRQGGMVGDSVIAHLVVAKFADQLPLERQRGILARLGANLADATLRGAYAFGLQKLHETFAEPLTKALLSCSLIQTDPTGFRVLDPDNCPRSSHRGTVTGYLGDGRLPFLEYTVDGKGTSSVLKHLSNFKAKLLTDASNLFHRLRDAVTWFLCNAHARRRFKLLADRGDRAAQWVIEQYRQIYRLETLADLKGLTPTERRKLRRKHTLPIMKEMHRVLLRILKDMPPSESFARAARYFTKNYDGLTRFIDHGDVPPDNNASESLLRTIRLTENNSLFAGSHDHARKHATAWALMKSCRIEGINPYAWMVDVLGKLAAGWPKDSNHELLPHNWKAAALDAAPAT